MVVAFLRQHKNLSFHFSFPVQSDHKRPTWGACRSEEGNQRRSNHHPSAPLRRNLPAHRRGGPHGPGNLVPGHRHGPVRPLNPRLERLQPDGNPSQVPPVRDQSYTRVQTVPQAGPGLLRDLLPYLLGRAAVAHVGGQSEASGDRTAVLADRDVAAERVVQDENDHFTDSDGQRQFDNGEERPF